MKQRNTILIGASYVGHERIIYAALKTKLNNIKFAGIVGVHY